MLWELWGEDMEPLSRGRGSGTEYLVPFGGKCLFGFEFTFLLTLTYIVTVFQ